MPNATDDWQEWVRRYGPGLLVYARQFVASAADAEDALQDGFVSFWKKYGSAGSPTTLYAFVRGRAMDIRRAERRRDRRNMEHARSPELIFEPAPDRLERIREIEAAVAMLKLPQREVLTLKIWGGLTFEHIGRTLGINPHTAAARYRYALGHLRKRLQREIIYEQ